MTTVVGLSKAEMSTLLFQTIGYPIGTGGARPSSETIEQLTTFAFKSRVGLLFLEECLRHGVALGPSAQALHESLSQRRASTNDVMLKLTRRLNEVAKGEWVLFKSVKPFAATPNDTDWFPLDPTRHAELCRHLLADGDFRLLEKAPLQTTLIESGGEGLTDTTKRGGVYYIDCYIYPGTDYFIYLDPRRLRDYVSSTDIDGELVPVLAPPAELAAIMFHNIFPERSFSVESYYLIRSYLEQVRRNSDEQRFVDLCRDQKMEYAAACNLAAVKAIDAAQFGFSDPDVDRLLVELGYAGFVLPGFDPNDAFPYQFSNSVFWRTFLLKQRDPTSLRSSLNQALHMLNPLFLADVIHILWKRCVRGGVYEQN